MKTNNQQHFFGLVPPTHLEADGTGVAREQAQVKGLWPDVVVMAQFVEYPVTDLQV